MKETYYVKDGVLSICYDKKISIYAIPDGVHTVDFCAFSECDNVKKIIVPKSVVKFNEGLSASLLRKLECIEVDGQNPAFKSCDGVLFSKDGKLLLNYPMAKKDSAYTVPSGVETIGKEAFYGAKRLSHVTLPEGVVEIRDMAFSLCSRLSAVALPATLRYIRRDVFCECTSLSRLELPRSLAEIDETIFRGCDMISDITVNYANSYFKSQDGVLFSKDGSKLIAYPPQRANESYTVPRGVQLIGPNAFFGAARLKSIELCNTVTAIGHHAFCKCSSLSQIMLPDSLLTLGDGAFCQSGLKTVYIPSLLGKIGHMAFGECPFLEKFVVLGVNLNFTVLDDVLFSWAHKKLICYPPNRKNTDYRPPAGTTEIAEAAFLGANNLKRVYLSNNVSVMGKSAFSRCKNLESCELSKSISVIEEFTFDECSSLVLVQIPQGVGKIDALAFMGCKNLAGIDIPDSVTEINEFAFDGCKSIKKITIPARYMDRIKKLFKDSFGAKAAPRVKLI